MDRPWTLPVAPARLRYAGVLACAAVVLAVSVIDPGDGTPPALLGVETTVVLHLLAYGGLAVAVGYAQLAVDRRALVVAALAATLYGAGVELVQVTLPYRTMSGGDVLVNAVGAVAGALLWRVLAPVFGAGWLTTERGAGLDVTERGAGLDVTVTDNGTYRTPAERKRGQSSRPARNAAILSAHDPSGR